MGEAGHYTDDRRWRVVSLSAPLLQKDTDMNEHNGLTDTTTSPSSHSFLPELLELWEEYKKELKDKYVKDIQLGIVFHYDESQQGSFYDFMEWLQHRRKT